MLRSLLPSLVFFFAAALAVAEPAAGPQVLTGPAGIGPGDILVVTIANAGTAEGRFNGKRLHFNRIGKNHTALAGIDLNAEAGSYRLDVTADGARLTRSVKISPKTYPVQRLTLPPDMVTLSPENEARVEREQKRMAALWPVDSLRLWQGAFIDPLPGKEVVTVFGVRRIINKIPKNSHSGVDIDGNEGDPVRSPNDGVVVLTDDQFYSGKSVVVDHGQGIYTMFFHLSNIAVRHGQAVMKGDVIGAVGSTGRSTGPHLHWGVRMQGAKVNPFKLLGVKLDE